MLYTTECVITSYSIHYTKLYEVIDLPQDIAEKEDALALHDVRGDLEFEDVTFMYRVDESKLLSEVVITSYSIHYTKLYEVR